MSPPLPTILVVDDEKDNLEALQRLLRGSYEVTTTTSPFQALKLVAIQEFHVIVSDQRMPEMTGVELLEKIKKLAPDSTRILLTGYTDIESVIDAINRGNIYRYIAKPWDPEDFKMTVRQADEAFKMKRELAEKNRALTIANEELAVLDAAKGRFLSLISHELNTPLTVLNSFVQLLTSQKEALSADVKKAVESISGASDRFSEIISEVLTYVKLDANGALVLKETDLSKEIQSIAKSLQGDFGKKNVTLKIQCPAPLSFTCDVEKMQTLIRKILQDALVRAPKGSAVTIEGVSEPGGVMLKITREGEPLPKSAFEPLEAGASQMHHQKNLGLALATCKTIVSLHKGTIAAEGSTLEVKFNA